MKNQYQKWLDNDLAILVQKRPEKANSSNEEKLSLIKLEELVKILTIRRKFPNQSIEENLAYCIYIELILMGHLEEAAYQETEEQMKQKNKKQ